MNYEEYKSLKEIAENTDTSYMALVNLFSKYKDIEYISSLATVSKRLEKNIYEIDFIMSNKDFLFKESDYNEFKHTCK